MATENALSTAENGMTNEASAQHFDDSAEEEAERPEAARIEGLPATASGLDWLDRRFGAIWSGRSLRTCLALALVYGWATFFLGWGLGAAGEIGGRAMLADPPQPARLLSSLTAVLLPLLAMLAGRWLGRLERRSKLAFIRRRRRHPKQFRRRLRVDDFERRYRWVLGLIFGGALVAAIIWFRRGDVAAFTILFSWLALGPVSGIAIARRFAQPTTQGLAALIAGFASIGGAVLLILAFAGAGVSAFAFAILGVTNIAFAGALGVLLEIVMGGLFTLGLALAGAGVATVALALAGAGTGIATLTGVATMSRAGLGAFILLMGGASLATVAFSQATVLAAAIGGISALSVAAVVSHNRRGRHGAYAGAIGAITLFITAAVLLGWGYKPLVIFAACFFFLLPLINGVIDWLAWAATRSLVKFILVNGPSVLMLLPGIIFCLAIGAALMMTLTFSLGIGFEAYNQFTIQRSGLTAFDLATTIRQAAADPWGKGLWLSLMLLTPVLPILFQAWRLVTDGLLALQPSDYRFRRVLFSTVGVTVVSASAFLLGWSITQSPHLEVAPILGALAKTGTETAQTLWQNTPLK